uniref:Uncharacterized protein n=1 Tax=Lepeophtheirus salmonis TaxID=72036 RepID=A0A0K2U8S0_LEPSM
MFHLMIIFGTRNFCQTGLFGTFMSYIPLQTPFRIKVKNRSVFVFKKLAIVIDGFRCLFSQFGISLVFLYSLLTFRF